MNNFSYNFVRNRHYFCRKRIEQSIGISDRELSTLASGE